MNEILPDNELPFAVVGDCKRVSGICTVHGYRVILKYQIDNANQTSPYI